MNTPDLARRGFLRKTGLTAAGALALSLTGLSISPNAWAMTLTTMDQSTGKSLSALCRTLYPHQHLDDMFYDACAEGLDSKAAADPAILEQLISGVQILDTLCAGSFLEATAAERLAAVKQIEGFGFFAQVRSHVVVGLYNNEKLWASFGYEGPSFPHGGYLERGFNDISWLPES